LIDPDIRTLSMPNVRWANAVVVFDEAHNIEVGRFYR
jgi:Rad3-related DNA helicase